jgi:hypothetical protein
VESNYLFDNCFAVSCLSFELISELKERLGVSVVHPRDRYRTSKPFCDVPAWYPMSWLALALLRGFGSRKIIFATQVIDFQGRHLAKTLKSAAVKTHPVLKEYFL